MILALRVADLSASIAFYTSVIGFAHEASWPDADIAQIPVEGNNNAVLSVYRGDAAVSFGYWDARTTVVKEAPDVADKVVAFAYTEMIPNGGVAVSCADPGDQARVRSPYHLLT